VYVKERDHVYKVIGVQQRWSCWLDCSGLSFSLLVVGNQGESQQEWMLMLLLLHLAGQTVSLAAACVLRGKFKKKTAGVERGGGDWGGRKKR
jgi:hypothetical protein